MEDVMWAHQNSKNIMMMMMKFRLRLLREKNIIGQNLF